MLAACADKPIGKGANMKNIRKILKDASSRHELQKLIMNIPDELVDKVIDAVEIALSNADRNRRFENSGEWFKQEWTIKS